MLLPRDSNQGGSGPSNIPTVEARTGGTGIGAGVGICGRPPIYPSSSTGAALSLANYGNDIVRSSNGLGLGASSSYQRRESLTEDGADF